MLDDAKLASQLVPSNFRMSILGESLPKLTHARVTPRGIERKNATRFAEPTLCLLGSPFVKSCSILQALIHLKSQLVCRDNEMNVLAHTTIRAVAIPSDDVLPVAFNNCSHPPTVTLNWVFSLVVVARHDLTSL